MHFTWFTDHNIFHAEKVLYFHIVLLLIIQITEHGQSYDALFGSWKLTFNLHSRQNEMFCNVKYSFQISYFFIFLLSNITMTQVFWKSGVTAWSPAAPGKNNGGGTLSTLWQY